MPFTNETLVKKHLADFQVGQVQVRDLHLVLSGVEPVQLPHTGLDAASVVVKANELAAPVLDILTLGSEWESFSHADVVPGSAVVANNSSLSTIYTENVDYTLDYVTGNIRRVTTGSIEDSQTIYVWYFYYHRYTPDIDYYLDVNAGTISRLLTGTIEDGQAVLVDYDAGLGTLSEDVINQAISEADHSILQQMDHRFQNSADPALITAETYWAVAILCRVRAGSALANAGTRSTAVSAAAKAWLDLADRYQDSATRLLLPFRALSEALRPPHKISGNNPHSPYPGRG